METTPFNLNDQFLVKLTPIGIDLYRKYIDNIYQMFPGYIREKLITQSMKSFTDEINSDGYSKFQFHDFMKIYGPHIGNDHSNRNTGGMPFETNCFLINQP